MTAPVAVTGATGQLGGKVAAQLAELGIPQRLLVRDPARAPKLAGATVHTAPYHHAEAVRQALTGVDTLFLVSGSESLDRVAQHFTVIDAAVAAGVSRIVYTSFYGAAPASTFTLARDHYATEEHLRRSGLGFTFLRDNLYLDLLPHFGGADRVIRGPAGDGRAAAVAVDDIADVAVTVLRDPAGHAGARYDLTGPAALSLAELAETVSRVTGEPLRYQAETIEEAYASRAVYAAPDWQVDAWVSTYLAIANGELAGVTDHVEQVTGHPATSLEQLLTR